MNAYLSAHSPRYVVSKLLYRAIRYFADTLPDIALIGGFTALFVLLWSKLFLK